MPIADILIDEAAGHKVLSFMDGTARYHKILVTEEDRHKTAFRCPGFACAFEYVVMPFGLKNARATYQRAMNLIFHDILGKLIEVYIDDVVVKTKTWATHIEELRQVFMWMQKHNLRMNPAKEEQYQLLGDDYVQAMWQELEDLDKHCITTFNNLILEKQCVAQSYDKITHIWSFVEGQAMGRAMLPLGKKIEGRRKWSAWWEGPFIIHRILLKGAYNNFHN
ncbi:hypothetical protein ACLB2K_026582 [Fragaria x ananassa]